MLNKLTAISPVDGRYRNTTETLADYFSEQALIRYRIRVEVEYFIALCEIPLPQLAGIDRTKFSLPRKAGTAAATRLRSRSCRRCPWCCVKAVREPSK